MRDNSEHLSSVMLVRSQVFILSPDKKLFTVEVTLTGKLHDNCKYINGKISLSQFFKASKAVSRRSTFF